MKGLRKQYEGPFPPVIRIITDQLTWSLPWEMFNNDGETRYKSKL